MRQVAIAFLALALVLGCHKADSGSDSTPQPTVGTAAAPTKSIIDSDKPQFEEMVRALKADPKDPKYKRQLLNIDIEVEERTESKKDAYLVTGTAGGLTIKVTFLIQPNLTLNQQARTLSKGDRVYFFCELAEFDPKPDPPVLTSYSGSILRISRKPK